MSVGSIRFQPFLLETRFQPRVWGGTRLGDGSEPIGEAWGAYDGNRIIGGSLDGLTLSAACLRHPEALLGTAAVAASGPRFPLLTKLLDTREWLSVQVHPDDEQAARLEGSGSVGKTEAWHLLETEPGAEIILGLQPGTDEASFARAVRDGRTLEVVARQSAVQGDTWLIPAGVVHALGPGIFLYEVQQSSDITYRVYDWGRPASVGRSLHIDQAIDCVDPAPSQLRYPPNTKTGESNQKVACKYFVHERVIVDEARPMQLDTGGLSFHALTSTSGGVLVSAPGAAVKLPEFGTVLVPASVGQYQMFAENLGATVMIASVPMR